MQPMAPGKHFVCGHKCCEEQEGVYRRPSNLVRWAEMGMIPLYRLEEQIGFDIFSFFPLQKISIRPNKTSPPPRFLPESLGLRRPG